ncbi:hypothetical protein CC2G_013869 [Coprinopsis cinerea AmutBmut pab1-1]|nr:hypothetical protein CC2G_013869 [Coprinopsis cinerea AmutBmut pab1-1]
MALVLPIVGMQIFAVISILVFHGESPLVTKRQRRPYVISSCIILVLSALGISIDLVKFANFIIRVADGRASDPGADTAWWALMGDVCNFLAVVFGDAVLVYRCYIIWNDRKWVITVPVLLLLSFIALGIASAAYDLDDHKHDIGFTSAWHFASAALNTVVTALIVGRLIHSRRRLAKLTSATNPRMYTGAVTILVESALPLTVVATLSAIMNLPSLKIPESSVFTALWVATAVRLNTSPDLSQAWML